LLSRLLGKLPLCLLEWVGSFSLALVFETDGGGLMTAVASAAAEFSPSCLLSLLELGTLSSAYANI